MVKYDSQLRACDDELIQPLEESLQLHSQCLGQSKKRLQPNFTSPPFQIRDVDFVNAGVLGKINLTPPFGLPYFSDALA